MTAKDFELIPPILEQYLSFKNQHLTYFINNLEECLTNFNTITKREIENIILPNNVTLQLYSDEINRIKNANEKTSFLFNSLRFFNIGETQHSFLLAKLLDPNAEHGQGDLFLKIFLSQIGITVFKNDKWIVTAETGRIDILIKRKHPHSVIIIENKSNHAIDQENQIYRYWYQEIYLPNKQLPIPVESTTNNVNYQIIYLTPANWKKPKENSLKKPSWYEDSLPERVPIEPIIWLFENEIVQWLKTSLDLLPEDNHRIRVYVKQYIELWKP